MRHFLQFQLTPARNSVLVQTKKLLLLCVGLQLEGVVYLFQMFMENSHRYPEAINYHHGLLNSNWLNQGRSSGRPVIAIHVTQMVLNADNGKMEWMHKRLCLFVVMNTDGCEKHFQAKFFQDLKQCSTMVPCFLCLLSSPFGMT